MNYSLTFVWGISLFEKKSFHHHCSFPDSDFACSRDKSKSWGGKYEGHSEVIDTRSQTKTRDLFINFSFNYVKVFTVEIEFFFRLF